MKTFVQQLLKTNIFKKDFQIFDLLIFIIVYFTILTSKNRYIFFFMGNTGNPINKSGAVDLCNNFTLTSHAYALVCNK